MDGLQGRDIEEDQRARSDRPARDRDYPRTYDRPPERDRHNDRPADRDDEDHSREDQKGSRGDDKAQDEKPPEAPKKPMSTGKKVLLIGIGLIVFAAIVIGGTLYWLDARRFETTDDAFIDGHIAIMAPQVAGRVISLGVQDNEMVKAGTLLVQIDPRDYQVKLDQAIAQQAQAQAQVEQARAQVTLQQATIDQSAANVRVSQADLVQAQQDLARYRAIDPKAITRQQLDNSSATSKAAQARLDASQHALAASQAQLKAQEAAVISAQASLKGADVAVENARLQLSYTELRSLQDGRVTKRTVEAGNYVTAGQALLDIVPQNVWVTANFKETQIALMKVGQPVDVSVDAVPDKVFHGHVDSFQAGSGSVFSALPAENATGNYVKVVQRVPVKIVLDDPSDARLAPGMSVYPKVQVRQ